MRQNPDQILTSHAGSLPRPEDLIDASRARESGMTTDERRFQDQLRSSVAEVVRLQKQAGMDVHPETFTHGSSAQRVRWFRRGFDTGQLGACDTFSASEL